MRIYIIGNDGITLCREAPATVNDGEVAVASKEELHAAPLSGKRLLGAVERSARCRKAQDGRRPRGPDRAAVAGNRGLAGPGFGARRNAAVKAGRGDCNAAATRGRNRR
jgi:hypothetical protein